MSTSTATNLKRDLLDIQKKNWDAWKARDGATLRALLDDQYLMVMDEGITDEDRTTFVDGMLSGDMQLKSCTLDESSAVVRELAPTVAVIAYKARPEMEQNGKPLIADYYFTTTYVKKGDNWVAVVGSASRAPTT